VIIGFVVLGAVIGLRPVVSRIGRKMREHCEQVMAGQVESGGEAGDSMRECCEQMMAGQFGDRGEAVGRA
jgi:hypothetical protein